MKNYYCKYLFKSIVFQEKMLHHQEH